MSAVVRSHRRVLCGLGVLLLAGCGRGEIEFSEINEARVLNNQPATFRDGGDLVTGTVVEKGADGTMVRRSEYLDGFPRAALRNGIRTARRNPRESWRTSPAVHGMAV